MKTAVLLLALCAAVAVANVSYYGTRSFHSQVRLVGAAGSSLDADGEVLAGKIEARFNGLKLGPNLTEDETDTPQEPTIWYDTCELGDTGVFAPHGGAIRMNEPIDVDGVRIKGCSSLDEPTYVIDGDRQWVGKCESIIERCFDPTFTGPQGEQGPQGETGPQGPQGIQGETGPQGDQGAQGLQGPKGDTGPQGDIGDTGPQGDVGAQGPKGDTGAIGPAGPQGEQGDTGPQGEKGDTGPIGATGVDGPQGEIGPAGADGADGAQGAAGPQGPKGDDGPQGPQGNDGPQGATGVRGTQLSIGSGVPTDTTGVSGDSYIDSDTGIIYQFNGASWDVFDSIGGCQLDETAWVPLCGEPYTDVAGEQVCNPDGGGTDEQNIVDSYAFGFQFTAANKEALPAVNIDTCGHIHFHGFAPLAVPGTAISAPANPVMYVPDEYVPSRVIFVSLAGTNSGGSCSVVGRLDGNEFSVDTVACSGTAPVVVYIDNVSVALELPTA